MPFDKRIDRSWWSRFCRWQHLNRSWLSYLIPACGFACVLLGGVGVLYYHADIESDGKSYIRPFCVSAIDKPLVGEVHFNNTIGESPFSKLFCKQIATAKSTVKGAMFSFSDPSVHQLLENTKASGKMVDLVLDEQRREAYLESTGYERKKPYSVRFCKTSSFSRMHHKFFVFDCDSTDAKLLFGSSNLTRSQDKYDPGYVFEISDRELAQQFSWEFDRLRQGVRGRQKFSDPNYRPFACHLQRSNGDTELWFSPGIGNNSFKQRLVEILSAAKSKIDIMMWQFTDFDLAKLLIAKANAGVRVRLVVEDEFATSSNSVVPFLQQTGNILIVTDAWRTAEVRKHNLRQAYFNPYMHYHAAVIDNHVVAAGSSNWSYAGFYTNDEANIVSTIDWVVESFARAFEHFFKMASPVSSDD